MERRQKECVKMCQSVADLDFCPCQLVFFVLSVVIIFGYIRHVCRAYGGQAVVAKVGKNSPSTRHRRFERRERAVGRSIIESTR